MVSPRHILSPPQVRLTANSSAVVSQRRSQCELLDTMREWASQSGPDPLCLCEHLRLRQRQMERIRALVKGHGARDAALPPASSSRNAVPPCKSVRFPSRSGRSCSRKCWSDQTGAP
ncbi:uncharacterized protein LOC123430452 [Hordeum vulgare subsp. vulgare]|uniref:uncharacterized protein LOC123430452 n=1 Tax=Hordeum vulgare subsp. vulgare TaxID=112509 RepID=UPI001D1A40F2|nr:uncharacterized protein LOC123430452 [Hordeum vulgare subsp. vulgare]